MQFDDLSSEDQQNILQSRRDGRSFNKPKRKRKASTSRYPPYIPPLCPYPQTRGNLYSYY